MFEPILSILAPREFKKWHSSWTCGSEAALRIIRSPAGCNGSHDGVFGGGDAGFIQQNIGTFQLAGLKMEYFFGALVFDLCAEGLDG